MDVIFKDRLVTNFVCCSPMQPKRDGIEMLKVLLKDDKDLRFRAISREKFLRDQISREGIAHEKGAYEKSLETAKILKESDVSNEIIIKSTGLTVNEIKNL